MKNILPVHVKSVNKNCQCYATWKYFLWKLVSGKSFLLGSYRPRFCRRCSCTAVFSWKILDLFWKKMASFMQKKDGFEHTAMKWLFSCKFHGLSWKKCNVICHMNRQMLNILRTKKYSTTESWLESWKDILFSNICECNFLEQLHESKFLDW